MGNRGKEDSRKARLPALLFGSVYKSDNSDIYREMNLLGMALAIVINADRDAASDAAKKAWLALFEEECRKAQLYRKKTIDLKARHDSNITPISDDAQYASPVFKMILDWLGESLSGSPDWERLHTLIGNQIASLGKDPCAEWWNKVRTICRKARTPVVRFRPIAEIVKLSEMYRTKDGGM